ncbi:MAG TPA: MaoC family dehydratase [Mycobacteriales bacterium]
MTRHFEDFTPGEVIGCGSATVDEAEMLAFARRFDPQPFHVDPQAAARSPFGGIIASGFFTAALWMRLYADAVLADSTSQGSPGMSELRWLSPVRAGDVLSGRITVLGAAPSATRPGRGTVMLRGELLRGEEVVLRCEFRGLFARRE